MRFDLGAVASACGGATSSPAVSVSGVSIDSRLVRSGALFVAIRAERDGHDFVVDAARRGAAAALVGARDGTDVWPLPVVTVADPQAALADLGAAARARMRCPVIGITGSVGKTTAKDLCGAILGVSRPVAVSERSHNNELGVPMTLVNAPDDVEAAVIEMGARGIGHIEWLCRLACPTIAVVTTVALAHTETFGSVEQIALAKGELPASLPTSGVAVLNTDVAEVWAMRGRTVGRVLGFGSAPEAEVRAHKVRLDDSLRPRFTLRTPWGDAKVRVAAAGVHNVTNALAASAAGLAAGASLDDVVAGLARARLSPNRMAVLSLSSGATVIDDCYNANPASMRAAFEALDRVDATRRVAVVGLMAELGDDAASAHAEVAELADERHVELIAVDTELYGVDPVSVDEVLERIGRLDSDVAVLVKGSRVARLESVVAALSAAG